MQRQRYASPCCAPVYCFIHPLGLITPNAVLVRCHHVQEVHFASYSSSASSYSYICYHTSRMVHSHVQCAVCTEPPAERRAESETFGGLSYFITVAAADDDVVPVALFGVLSRGKSGFARDFARDYEISTISSFQHFASVARSWYNNTITV